MTNVLAIDTTTDACSVALATNERQIAYTRIAPRQHNRLLLPMIDGVLRASSVAKDALNLVAFGAGPGAFTGVRIGAAAAQGIAFAVGAMVVAVPSADVLAETARHSAGIRGHCAIHRASRKGWRYCARFELLADRSVCRERDRLEPSHGTDSGSAESNSPNLEVIDGARFQVDAGIVAALALARLDRAVEPAFAQPLYVAGDSPWQPRGTPNDDS